MKICVNFYQGLNLVKQAHEVKIKINQEHTDAGLLKFLEARNPEQRIILDMTKLDAEDIIKWIPALNIAKGVHNNYAVLIDAGMHHDSIVSLYEENIPFFFQNHINTWERLVTSINAGVSDVYITDELGFDIQNVSAFCHDRNVKVRIYPNVAQSSSYLKTTGKLNKFFVRPEDIMFYDKYVDIYEFFGSIDKQSVLYRIYSSHQWMGSLDLLILGLDVDIYSDRLLPHFGEARTKCEKRCLQGRCDICSAAEDFARALYEHADFRIKVEYPHDYEELLTELEQEPNEELNEEFEA